MSLQDKYVSFSIWGKDPKYTVGAVKNAELCKKFYPGWIPIFFHDRSVPQTCLNDLADAGAELQNMTAVKGLHKMMWRFTINDRPEYDRYIVRDCDSRINEREVECVRAWIASRTPFHIMRDHPNHGKFFPIMGGMWGAKRGFLQSMETLIRCYKNPQKDYGFDQDFLRDCIWPKAKMVALQHDSETAARYKSEPFPVARRDHRFVGEVFDENDNPRDGEWQMVAGAPEIPSNAAKKQDEDDLKQENIVSKQPEEVSMKKVKKEVAIE